MQHQPSMSSIGDETPLEDYVVEEFNVVARDLHAKQQCSAITKVNYTPTSHGVDEQTKVQLAKRASQATAPGAVMEQAPASYDNNKPSHDQLAEIGNLRRMHKNRQVQQNREEHLPSELIRNMGEEQPLDDFQGRMNNFRNEENQRADMEDEVLRKRKSMGMKWFLVALIFSMVSMAIAGIGVSIAIGWRGGAEEVDTAETKAFHDCYLRNGSHSSDQYSQLKNVVESAWGGWDPNPVDSVGPSQRAALCWLSNFDTFELEHLDGTESFEVIQRFALVTIYYHFVGSAPESESQALSGSNWLTNVHVCEWNFVACDGTNNEVIELFLDDVRLGKPIPEEVALLSNLAVLKMTGCHLTGMIPSALSLLTQLKTLHLSFNKLSGTIPEELGGLIELRSLDLHGNNNIEGTIPEISRLTNLGR